MGKLTSGTKLVLASHNQGKLREFSELLAPYKIDVVSARELDLPEPEETGVTFAENAMLKASAAAEATGLPALADDSGLEVACLNGAPGIYSARWAGPEKDFAAAMQRVADAARAAGGWHGGGAPVANFNATLALVWPEGTSEVFEGKVFGSLQWPPRGDAGFGYDPMFQPDGASKTFGEMSADEKHGRLSAPNRSGKSSDWGHGGQSHRARACAAFIAACIDNTTDD